MKTLCAICLLIMTCCITGPDFSLEKHPQKRDFLLQFEKLLEDRYGVVNPNVLFKKFINENKKLLFQDHSGVCLEGIEKLMENQLLEQLWIPVKQTEGVLHFIDFNGWYCSFLEELNEVKPWIKEYQEIVCSAGDISPSAVVLFVENAANLNLKKEKVRFLVAVHFFSLIIEKGCLEIEEDL